MIVCGYWNSSDSKQVYTAFLRGIAFFFVSGLCLLLVTKVRADETESPGQAADKKEKMLPASEWSKRTYTEAGEARVSQVDADVALPAQPEGHPDMSWTPLAVDVSEPVEFIRSVEQSWAGWHELHVTLLVPPDLPDGCHVYFITKNWDSLWRQVRLPVTPDEDGIVHFELPIAGPEARAKWQPQKHNRPWHKLTPSRIREFGCKFEAPQDAENPLTANIGISRLRLVHPLEKEKDVELKSLTYAPESPQVGDKIEIKMQLDAVYRNPFDQEDINVQAEIACPDGQTVTVPGFYHEGFIPDSAERKPPGLIPYGPPMFRIRYTPKAAGKHKIRVEAGRGNDTDELTSFSISAEKAPSEYKGFIERDSDHPTYLQYETGEIFQGIGINVRAPYDTRYKEMIPFTRWENKGIQVYEEMFEKYEKNGINVVEVWMCSWWLALEWIPNAPGFHGVGHMNQYRAWLLDRIVQLAEQHDIYLLLVLHNHGKFSTHTDEEWSNNPYNEENGGFVKDCENYFDNKQAKEAFKRYARYIVARWGYSPYILTWKLFSEINLTGNDYKFYKEKPMENWHREMAKFLKEIDPFNHLVTTHWSTNYHVINRSIARIKDIDFLTTDAYAKTTKKLMKFFDGTVAYGEKLEKPGIITEYGGSPHGDDMTVLQRQVHLGLWKGYFSGAAIMPMLWWFSFVEEQNLYNHYKSLRRFITSEDRRSMSRTSRKLSGRNITLHLLKGEKRVLGWGYDQKHYLRSGYSPPRMNEEIELKLNAPEPGTYLFSVWNPTNGDIRQKKKINVEKSEKNDPSSKITVTVPAFRRDFAVKLIPARKE